MSILANLDKYIKESYIYEGYELAPSDSYDAESNVSFEVDDDGSTIAVVKIFKIDGTPVNAIEDTYDFADTYPDVELNIEGDADNYDKDNIAKWVVPKLMEMGYGENKIVFDGEELDLEKYGKSEESEEESEEDSEEESDEGSEDQDDDLEDVKNQVKDLGGDDDTFSVDDLEDYEK